MLAEAWHGFGLPEADLRDCVPDVACPVLIAWARHDKVIPYRQCRAAIDRFPNAETVFFEAGHSAFLEDPIAFGAAFERFLDRLGIVSKNSTRAMVGAETFESG